MNGDEIKTNIKNVKSIKNERREENEVVADIEYLEVSFSNVHETLSQLQSR